MLNRIYEISKKKIPVIIYGAGKKAREQIDKLSMLFHIGCIWDRNSTEKFIGNYEIKRPFEYIQEIGLSPVVLITIENPQIRKEVNDILKAQGYNEIYYTSALLQILEEISEDIGEKSLLKALEFCSLYDLIEFGGDYINYSLVRKERKWEYDRNNVDQLNPKQLISRLCQTLIIEADVIERVVTEWCISIKSADNLYISLEIFLRRLLGGRIKTRYRPIRMIGDEIYDPFAVFETIKASIAFLTNDDIDSKLNIVDDILGISFEKRYLEAVKCQLLIQKGLYADALKIARRLVRKAPTSFFENEIFYQTASAYINAGETIDEKMPPMDLSDRFCWSGMNYLWCGGKNKEGFTLFAPCFRAVECAARPQGDFNTSEEWKLFRDSIVDGSFRYCQKSQCPNIIGGWLPLKSQCNQPDVKLVLQNKRDHQLPIEELHLSYDKHCNLKCPSCRYDFCINSSEENDRLNEFFDHNLTHIIAHCKHLCLSGCGEALLSPHSKSILMKLSEISEADLKVELRTNMTVFNKNVWDSLGEGRRYIKHVAASIDGCTKATFEKIRFPAKWDVVKENLQFVSELRRKGEIDLFEIHVVVQLGNIDELYDIAMLAINLGADAVTYSKFVNWMGLDEESYAKINPFWGEHPRHNDLMVEIGRIMDLRERILKGKIKVGNGKPFYINVHYEKEPDSAYYPIRYGELKIR